MPLVHNLAWAVPSAERGFEPLGCLTFDRLHATLETAEVDRSGEGEFPAFTQCDCLLSKVVKLPFLPSANSTLLATAVNVGRRISALDKEPIGAFWHVRPPGRAPPSS